MRARIYARLIIKKRMTLTEVSEKYPTYLEEVKHSLIELGHPELTE